MKLSDQVFYQDIMSAYQNMIIGVLTLICVVKVSVKHGVEIDFSKSNLFSMLLKFSCSLIQK